MSKEAELQLASTSAGADVVSSTDSISQFSGHEVTPCSQNPGCCCCNMCECCDNQFGIFWPQCTPHDDGTTTMSLHPDFLRFIAYFFFWLMVGVSYIITALTINPLDTDKRTLIYVFGYNNVCFYFDYGPARIVASIIFPFAEIPFIVYLPLHLLRSYQLYKQGKWGRKSLITVGLLSFFAVFGVLWFRLVFIIRVNTQIFGHSFGFVLLMVSLVLVAVQSFMYNQANGTHPTENKILVYGYMGFLIAITAFKLTYALISIGNNWNASPGAEHNKSIVSVFQFIDSLWLLFAAIIPLGLSLTEMVKCPPFVGKF